MQVAATVYGDDWDARLSGLTLLIGAVTVTGGWHVLHTAETLDTGGNPSPGPAAGAALPVVASLALLVGVAWLARTDLGGVGLYRAGLWTGGCGLFASALGAAVVAHQFSNGVMMVERVYVIFSSATAGAATGFLLGIYDARLLTTVHRLSDERERTGRLEQRLRVLNRVLRHDIRNDANVIRGYAELLDDSKPAVAIRRRAANLAQTGENARYVEELIGADDLATGEVDVADVAAAATTAVREAYPDVTVELDTSDRAITNTNRLLDVAVENVVENAAEHNDAEEPVVRVRVETDGDGVAIEVADNGPGIPDDEVAVLSRGGETPLLHSSGLGLWLVNWVIEDCGGSVTFRERDPRGSIVRLELPSEPGDTS